MSYLQVKVFQNATQFRLDCRVARFEIQSYQTEFDCIFVGQRVPHVSFQDHFLSRQKFGDDTSETFVLPRVESFCGVIAATELFAEHQTVSLRHRRFINAHLRFHPVDSSSSCRHCIVNAGVQLKMGQDFQVIVGERKHPLLQRIDGCSVQVHYKIGPYENLQMVCGIDKLRFADVDDACCSRAYVGNVTGQVLLLLIILYAVIYIDQSGHGFFELFHAARQIVFYFKILSQMLHLQFQIPQTALHLPLGHIENHFGFGAQTALHVMEIIFHALQSRNHGVVDVLLVFLQPSDFRILLPDGIAYGVESSCIIFVSVADVEQQ
ncbi:hypothetical protein CEXT_422401 [Caerostris extrusa]|uniref:Uncharacterized protein n=1 Tax=Caerostris extrusa TaxID=172846 RepID=A0AAV4U2K6_CAEEX|nr:hypothetical protein CEXT_422401 [Caerostris extrusa]